ncbi:hypothetical protein VNO78_15482 [Psophocarpus tetragonolobus]|uniref:Thioredoxin domain-containing protein n=1 Tax=Psophocarpus tetragonolobus TaxID=3891 RepID=A0AAN9SFE9_PSOTE
MNVRKCFLIFGKVKVHRSACFRPLKFSSLWISNNNMGNCVAKHSQAKDSDSDHNVDFAAGNVKLITTKEAWDQHLEEARRDGKIVLANFSAAWCGPCKMIASYYCELSEKYTSIMFLLVDVDELTDFSTSWDIKATPTFFFLKDGQQLDKLVGANKPELLKKIVAINDTVPEYKQ